jgi:uncharacterized protein YodC (DUF2158 family)
MKIGDTVRLKSGGPVMTVNGTTDDHIHCVWFVKTDVKSSTFQKAALEAATDEITI